LPFQRQDGQICYSLWNWTHTWHRHL